MNGVNQPARRQVGRVIFSGVAAVLLLGSSAIWLNRHGGAGPALNSVRVTLEDERRTLDEYRRSWDQKRRSWEQRRRAEDQAQRQTGASVTNAGADPAVGPPSPLQ